MIKLNKFFKINVLTILIVSFLTVTVYGQEAGTKPVADEIIGASGISWMPKVSYSRLVLTISRPDGTVFSTTFDSGKTPYADISSILGNDYADGSYTYELRVIPTNAKKFRQESDLKVTGEARGKNHKALIQSGYFFVRGGVIASPDEPEGSAREPVGPGNSSPDPGQEGLSGTADVCYTDDLIVDGSLSVGFDSVCNYSFGFDTIVLRENNLRIFFDDTSTTGSFPRNDWRIIANDSANGGASYFGIEDSTAGRRVFTLEAGAPSHSLYIDDGGRLGLGTSTPVVDAHIVSGNTPTLRLEQDGSSGFSPQTWDVAGNETSFFIRDATNGSQLPFRIRPGADSNSLIIDSDNNIGIGILSPGFPLHMRTTSGTAATAVFEDSGGAQAQISAGTSFVFIGSKTNNDFRLTVNDSPQMTLTTGGKVGIGVTSVAAANKLEVDNGARLTTGGVWTNGSSREFKENIQNLTTDEAMEALDGLNPVKFNYKKQKQEEYVGFIAEDVPGLVAMNDRKGLAPMDIVAVLTKVVKEQQKTISQLKKEIADLKKK